MAVPVRERPFLFPVPALSARSGADKKGWTTQADFMQNVFYPKVTNK